MNTTKTEVELSARAGPELDERVCKLLTAAGACGWTIYDYDRGTGHRIESGCISESGRSARRWPTVSSEPAMAHCALEAMRNLGYEIMIYGDGEGYQVHLDSLVRAASSFSLAVALAIVGALGPVD